MTINCITIATIAALLTGCGARPSDPGNEAPRIAVSVSLLVDQDGRRQGLLLVLPDGTRCMRAYNASGYHCDWGQR